MDEGREAGTRKRPEAATLDRLFATLRASLAEPGPTTAAPPPAVRAGPERAWPPRPAATVGSPVAGPPGVDSRSRAPDHPALRAVRDAAIGAVLPMLERRAKRHLQDEQNELMDALRRQRAKVDARRAFPSEELQVAVWAEILAPAVGEVYRRGRNVSRASGPGRGAPTRLVHDLGRQLVIPLRERLVASVDNVVAEGAHETTEELHRTLATAVAARYREWRAQELGTALGDLLAVAFARGAYDAAPSGARLCWIPAEHERCPDADDNALEPTTKGRAFPTGQSCPPAHPGCRCFVVPC